MKCYKPEIKFPSLMSSSICYTHSTLSYSITRWHFRSKLLSSFFLKNRRTYTVASLPLTLIQSKSVILITTFSQISNSSWQKLGSKELRIACHKQACHQGRNLMNIQLSKSTYIPIILS